MVSPGDLLHLERELENARRRRVQLEDDSRRVDAEIQQCQSYLRGLETRRSQIRTALSIGRPMEDAIAMRLRRARDELQAARRHQMQRAGVRM
jgi:predicted  nucleic acid-binding Zn-ribbon protein